MGNVFGFSLQALMEDFYPNRFQSFSKVSKYVYTENCLPLPL